MCLARLRRFSRGIALVLLASFWGLSHWTGDDACALIVEAHDESRHAIGAATGETPDHCAVCHSLRTPRRPFGRISHVASPFLTGVVIDTSTASLHLDPAHTRVPARAPPIC